MPEIYIDLNQNNLAKAEAMIEQIPIEIEELLQELYREAGERIVERAQALAPLKTGLLRSMIGFIEIPDGINVECDVPYASYQEYGTRYIVAKFFLTTAIDEIMPEIDQEAERIIDEYLNNEASELEVLAGVAPEEMYLLW